MEHRTQIHEKINQKRTNTHFSYATFLQGSGDRGSDRYFTENVCNYTLLIIKTEGFLEYILSDITLKNSIRKKMNI